MFVAGSPRRTCLLYTCCFLSTAQLSTAQLLASRQLLLALCLTLFFVYCFTCSLFIVFIMLLMARFYADVRAYSYRTRMRCVEHSDCVFADFVVVTVLLCPYTLCAYAPARVVCVSACLSYVCTCAYSPCLFSLKLTYVYVFHIFAVHLCVLSLPRLLFAPCTALFSLSYVLNFCKLVLVS